MFVETDGKPFMVRKSKTPVWIFLASEHFSCIGTCSIVFLIMLKDVESTIG